MIRFFNSSLSPSKCDSTVFSWDRCNRPISTLLTSLTTFFALLPMIMEKSVQAQFLIPMAVSLGFGIMFATCIILLGVPAGMKNLDVILGWIQRAKARDEKVDTHLMPNPVG